MAGKSNLMELRERNIANQRAAAEAAAEVDAAEEDDREDSADANITSNTVSRSYDLPEDSQAIRQADTQVSQPPGTPVDLSSGRSNGKASRRQSDRSGDRSLGSPVNPPPDLRHLLKQMSGTTMIPVTLKVPAGINEYIDEHIHDQWKEKIKKQDVLKRALLLAIYEIETGTQLVTLDL